MLLFIQEVGAHWNFQPPFCFSRGDTTDHWPPAALRQMHAYRRGWVWQVSTYTGGAVECFCFPPAAAPRFRRSELERTCEAAGVSSSKWWRKMCYLTSYNMEQQRYMGSYLQIKYTASLHTQSFSTNTSLTYESVRPAVLTKLSRSLSVWQAGLGYAWRPVPEGGSRGGPGPFLWPNGVTPTAQPL